MDKLTYELMPAPRQLENRIVRRIVDGVEQDVEIEVEVEIPLKRLFLFPSKDEVNSIKPRRRHHY